MKKFLGHRTAILLTAILAVSASCANVFGPSDETAAQIEQEIFKIVNDHRRSIGAVELVWNDTIAEQARLHSQSMADGTVPFGHDGYEYRFAMIGQTIPWQQAAEVIALAPTATSALDAWLASTEHRPWVEGNYRLTGVGVVKAKTGGSFYATQIFILPR